MAHMSDELRLLREGESRVCALSLPLLYTSVNCNIKFCVHMYWVYNSVVPRKRFSQEHCLPIGESQLKLGKVCFQHWCCTHHVLGLYDAQRLLQEWLAPFHYSEFETEDKASFLSIFRTIRSVWRTEGMQWKPSAWLAQSNIVSCTDRGQKIQR